MERLNADCLSVIGAIILAEWSAVLMNGTDRGWGGGRIRMQGEAEVWCVLDVGGGWKGA